jgi:hypothetical protein
MGVIVGVDRELDLEAAAGERLEPRLIDRKRTSHAPNPHDRRPTKDPRHLLTGVIDDAKVGKAGFGHRGHLRLEPDRDELLPSGGSDADRAPIAELVDGGGVDVVRGDGDDDPDEETAEGGSACHASFS